MHTCLHLPQRLLPSFSHPSHAHTWLLSPLTTSSVLPPLAASLPPCPGFIAFLCASKRDCTKFESVRKWLFLQLRPREAIARYERSRWCSTCRKVPATMSRLMAVTMTVTLAPAAGAQRRGTNIAVDVGRCAHVHIRFVLHALFFVQF